jgi:diacylglycerol O-acyltransferase / wax synthase
VTTVDAAVDAAADGSWDAAVAAFFDADLPIDRPPWQLLVLRDDRSGRTAVLASVHHALGDGVAMTDALIRLLVDRPPAAVGGRAENRRAGRAGVGHRVRRGAHRAALGVRGLGSLAGTTAPPPDGLAPVTTSARRYALADLPAAKVRAVAREHGVSTTALLVAVVAGALHEYLDGRAGTAEGQWVRAMVPLSTRPVRGGADGGNRTAAMSLELPVGPLPPRLRLTRVAAALAELGAGGQPAATDAVLAAQALLPAPVHARIVRLIGGRRFFNMIVSVLPGARRDHRILGARIAVVHPVLSLGTSALGIGLISWGDAIGIGITADAVALPDTDELARCLALALDEVAASPPDRREVG